MTKSAFNFLLSDDAVYHVEHVGVQTLLLIDGAVSFHGHVSNILLELWPKVGLLHTSEELRRGRGRECRLFRWDRLFLLIELKPTSEHIIRK